MTDAPLPAPLHDRLTVVRTEPGSDAGELARRLVAGLTGAVLDADDIRRSAVERTVASYGERAAARDQAVARRAELAARRTHLLERAEWCESTAASARALTAARANADAAVAEARHEVELAAARRDRVAQQRAAAKDAVDEATVELEGLDGAAMDENGVRRQLETATREERDATAALAAAEASLQSLEARLAELDETRDELVAAREAIASAGERDDTDPEVEAAVADALAVYDELAERGGVDQRAVALSRNIVTTESDLEELRRRLPEPPTDAQIQGAEADVAAARRRVDNAKAAAASFDGPPPPWWVELNGLHAQVVDAETALQTAGFRKGGLRKRYEDAIAAERVRLDELGFDGYLDALMSGGRLPEDKAKDEEAIIRESAALAEAEEFLEQLWEHRRVGAPLIGVRDEYRRLLAEAATMLACDPAGRAVELLRNHPAVPAEVVADLAHAVRRTGTPTAGIGVAAAARNWLAARASATDPTRLATLEQRIAETAAERAAVERAIVPATHAVEHAAATAASAARTVGTLEGELRTRAGDDSRLLDRAIAARSLREQVEAVEARLAQAEADAVAAEAASTERLAAVEAERERVEQELHDLTRRANRAASELPPPRRPAFDLITGMVPLAGALRAEASTVADLLAEADAAVAAAEAAAGGGPDHPTIEDLVEGLRAAVLDARRRTSGPVVLAEPLAGVGIAATQPVLEALSDATVEGPAVVVTGDLDVVGWAIGLPPGDGALVAARSLDGLLVSTPATAYPAAD